MPFHSDKRCGAVWPSGRVQWALPAPSAEPIPAAHARGAQDRYCGNNTLWPDCVQVMCVNAVIDELARAGNATPADFPTPPVKLARDLYIAVNGMDPAAPDAPGTIPAKMFAWWQKNAILGFRLKRAIPVQPNSEYALRRTIAQRGRVGLIVRLTEAQQEPGPWEYVTGAAPWADHAVLADEYGADPLDATSWGLRQPIGTSFIESQVLAAFEFELVAV